MESVSQYIDSYFTTHQDKLLNSYPGLISQRLKDEYLKFFSLKENEYVINDDSVFFDKIKKGIPLEYIQSEAYFFRSHFYVNQNTLIPRSETEILVEDCVGFIKKNQSNDFSLAEVGVGAFNIGLSILMELSFPISFYGTDICKDALDIAKLNQFRLTSKIHPLSDIQLEKIDRLEGCTQVFDLIVSNPPYIKKEMGRDGVHWQADHFEPEKALYLADDEYLDWFDLFFKQIIQCLKEKGCFMMEGHEDELKSLAELASQYFTKVELKSDYTNRLRFLHGYR